MREVARTPLFAALLCSIVEAGEDMPSTEYELYERRFDLLTGRWERAKGIAPLSKRVREAYLQLLMSLAFHLHSNERRAARETEVLFLARRYQVVEFHRSPRDVVEDCIQRGLLVREPGGDLSLGHLTYQEYFAGLWLAEKGSPAFVWSRLCSSWWEKAIEFYAARRKDIDDLLSEAVKFKKEYQVISRLESLAVVAWMTSTDALKALKKEAHGARRVAFDWTRLPDAPIVLREE
jgi:hypothetical protein